ncbi:MAG: hypothetical protein ABEI74_04265 [Candidatus Pacearchaeota archaeon]
MSTIFQIIGSYTPIKDENLERFLEGEIEISKGFFNNKNPRADYFEGEVTDNDLVKSRRYVKGMIQKPYDTFKIDFMKAPINSEYSRLIHSLSENLFSRAINPDSYVGSYEGLWLPAGENFSFDKNSDFFTRNLDYNGRNSRKVSLEILNRP